MLILIVAVVKDFKLNLDTIYAEDFSINFLFLI